MGMGWGRPWVWLGRVALAVSEVSLYMVGWVGSSNPVAIVGWVGLCLIRDGLG